MLDINHYKVMITVVDAHLQEFVNHLAHTKIHSSTFYCLVSFCQQVCFGQHQKFFVTQSWESEEQRKEMYTALELFFTRFFTEWELLGEMAT